LIQGSATILYLANPKALEKDYIHHFKCTQREYALIKQFDPQSRYFLIKQSNESAIGRIDLQGLSQYLHVLSGNTSSVAYCDHLRNEMGDDPEIWLPHFYKGMVQ
jgi:type IV secretion system protein VirB4